MKEKFVADTLAHVIDSCGAKKASNVSTSKHKCWVATLTFWNDIWFLTNFSFIPKIAQGLRQDNIR